MSSNLSTSHGKGHGSRKQLIDELGFLGQMASTETALFHQAAAAKYGSSITDMKTVSTLMQEGPMTAGQIAKRLSLTTGAVTNVIDRLERRGVVERKPDASDRRKVIVTINASDDMFRSRENIYQSIGNAFAELLENYSVEQLEFLVQYYKASIELTKQEIAKLADNQR